MARQALRDAGDISQTARWSVLLNPGGRVVTQSHGSARFDGELRLKTFDAVHLCSIKAGPHSVFRRQVAGSYPKLISAIIQIGGRSVVTQNDRSIELRAGEWCMHYTARQYAVVNSEEVDQLLVMVPEHVVDPLTQRLAGNLAEALSIDQGCGRLLYEYALQVFDQSEPADERTAETAGRNILDILNTACGSVAGAPMPRGTELSFERARLHVDRNFQDAEFKIETIARHMNCTKRYLHKIFSERGVTVDGYIWRLRVMRAAKYLESPANRNLSIADLSYACGFGSATHFSSLFKRSFGVTPSQYRNAIPAGHGGRPASD